MQAEQTTRDEGKRVTTERVAMALFQDPKKGEMAGFIGVAVIACVIFGSQLITKISSGTLSF